MLLLQAVRSQLVLQDRASLRKRRRSRALRLRSRHERRGARGRGQLPARGPARPLSVVVATCRGVCRAEREPEVLASFVPGRRTHDSHVTGGGIM